MERPRERFMLKFKPNSKSFLFYGISALLHALPLGISMVIFAFSLFSLSKPSIRASEGLANNEYVTVTPINSATKQSPSAISRANDFSGKRVAEETHSDIPNSVSGGISESKLEGVLQPEYPRISRERNEEGIVEISLEVDENGNVLNPEVVRSSGYPRLDSSALKAIAKSHFLPANRNGRAIPSKSQLSVRFELKSK